MKVGVWCQVSGVRYQVPGGDTSGRALRAYRPVMVLAALSSTAATPIAARPRPADIPYDGMRPVKPPDRSETALKEVLSCAAGCGILPLKLSPNALTKE